MQIDHGIHLWAVVTMTMNGQSLYRTTSVRMVYLLLLVFVLSAWGGRGASLSQTLCGIRVSNPRKWQCFLSKCFLWQNTPLSDKEFFMSCTFMEVSHLYQFIQYPSWKKGVSGAVGKDSVSLGCLLSTKCSVNPCCSSANLAWYCCQDAHSV